MTTRWSGRPGMASCGGDSCVSLACALCVFLRAHLAAPLSFVAGIVVSGCAALGVVASDLPFPSDVTLGRCDDVLVRLTGSLSVKLDRHRHRLRIAPFTRAELRSTRRRIQMSGVSFCFSRLVPCFERSKRRRATSDEPPTRVPRPRF